MDAIVDRFVVRRRNEKAIKAGVLATLLVGDGLMRIEIVKGASKAESERFYKATTSAKHHVLFGDVGPAYFVFNLPESACRTCGGLGVHKLTHPELLIPDPTRSIVGGCFVREAFRYNPDNWDGRLDLQPVARDGLLDRDAVGEAAGVGAQRDALWRREEKFPLLFPPGAKDKRPEWEGKEVGFQGIARRIERHYRRYRQRGEASSGMEAWLDRVMVEHVCPDCQGSRLRADANRRSPSAARRSSTSASSTLMSCAIFCGGVKPTGRGADAGTAGASARSSDASSCCSASASTTSTSIDGRQRSPAANRSASDCRRRSAPGLWACSTCSTSRASGCIPRTT